MAESIIDQIIMGQIPSYPIFEDDVCMAILDVNGAAPGHTMLFPKKKYPILEQIPDSVLGHLLNVANKISGVLFEKLKAQGTNIFITNGIPAGQTIAHVIVHIIPRTQNDGIDLTWQPTEIQEEEFATIELKIKDQVKQIGVGGVEKKPAAKTATPKPPLAEDEDDYYLNQIRRIP